ncbi:deubiquitinating enzyme [Savitreella phatthalungensis]
MTGTGTVPITIKWAGNKPFNVDVDLSQDGATLKMQVYSLTGVEVDRQKILVKGGPLKDDTPLSKLGLKAGQTLMMMGSATALPQAAELDRPTFVEDMDNKSFAQATKYPPGLHNLGNTCYMNSTLQLLRAVPELQQDLKQYVQSSASGSAAGASGGAALTGSLRDLFKSMEASSDAVSPAMFLGALRSNFPQFAERSRSGMGYAQQDAEECFSQILHVLRSNVKGSAGGNAAAAGSALDAYLGGRLHATMRNSEDPSEPSSETVEDFAKLNCHISATTNFMMDGIKSSLHDEITKRSESLGRDAVYVKDAKVSRLPKYLFVGFVRFFYKAGIQKKAKILRKVGFPFDLDALELCTDELRSQLAPIRDRVREAQKEAADRERSRKRAKTDLSDDAAPVQSEAEAAKALRDQVDSMLTPEQRADLGANHSGLYELVGVLTHSGASADSGHYQAWIKAPEDEGSAAGSPPKQEKDQEWYRFNDDTVTIVTRERIEQLAGGGESDSIYLALYRSRF